MYAILRFLFPDKPYTAGNSWLLLAARIIFGGLLMSHGIAKWQNFDALSAAFPDPLGVGSGVSLALAIFGEVVCSVGFIAGLFYRLALIPMIFDVRGFLRRTRRRSVRGARTGAGLSVGLRADVRRRSRSLCGRYADCSASSEAAAVVAPHPYPDSAPIPSLPEEAMDVCRIFAGRMPRARQANSLSAR